MLLGVTAWRMEKGLVVVKSPISKFFPSVGVPQNTKTRWTEKSTKRKHKKGGKHKTPRCQFFFDRGVLLRKGTSPLVLGKGMERTHVALGNRGGGKMGDRSKRRLLPKKIFAVGLIAGREIIIGEGSALPTGGCNEVGTPEGCQLGGRKTCGEGSWGLG